MGRWMRGALALLVLCVAASPAAAREIANSQTIRATDPVEPSATGVYDGARWRSWKGTSEGVGVVKIDNLPNWQPSYSTMATVIGIHTGLKQIGNSVTAYPYGMGSLEITRAATGGVGVDRLFLYIYGSENDTDFYPVLQLGDVTQSATTGKSLWAGDTTAVDTLMLEVPTKGPGLTWVVPLPKQYFGKYLAVWARRDSTLTSAQTLTVKFRGRWY